MHVDSRESGADWGGHRSSLVGVVRAMVVFIMRRREGRGDFGGKLKISTSFRRVKEISPIFGRIGAYANWRLKRRKQLSWKM